MNGHTIKDQHTASTVMWTQLGACMSVLASGGHTATYRLSEDRLGHVKVGSVSWAAHFRNVWRGHWNHHNTRQAVDYTGTGAPDTTHKTVQIVTSMAAFSLQDSSKHFPVHV